MVVDDGTIRTITEATILISVDTPGFTESPWTFPIQIQWRGHKNGLDWYAITRDGPFNLSRTGNWDYEPLASDRTEDWLEQHRYTFVEAHGVAMATARRIRDGMKEKYQLLTAATDQIRADSLNTEEPHVPTS